MEIPDLLAPDCYYAIRVGFINYVAIQNLSEMEAFAGYTLKKKLEEATVLLLFERQQGIPLIKFLEKNSPQLLERHLSLLQPNWHTQLTELLEFYHYWPLQIEGYVYPMYPFNLLLKPEADEFSFYFALRLSQLPIEKIDPFLSYQLEESFDCNKTRYYRFLQLCTRTHKEELLGAMSIQTMEEWIELNRMESTPLEKREKTTETGVKITCKADTETIYKYFHQLTKKNVLPREATEHILYYAFSAFGKEVPAKKFTPVNIRKGELMKFVQHFYTVYSYARLESSNWIKLLLIDSTNVFESKDRTEEETIQYIKDNWSKEPVQYSFQRP